jgi:hypothetical protein
MAEEGHAERPRVQRTGAASLALRLAGAGYDEIADALALPSAEIARAQAETALAARAWDDLEGRKQMRAENAARIERLLRSVWRKATDEDHPEHLLAVRVAQGLIDRHIKLYGLDAPTEVVVHNPTATEIEQWVAGMIAEGTRDLRSMEASVIDVELVEP